MNNAALPFKSSMVPNEDHAECHSKIRSSQHHLKTQGEIPLLLGQLVLLPLGLVKWGFAFGPYLDSFSLHRQFRKRGIESYRFNKQQNSNSKLEQVLGFTV